MQIGDDYIDTRTLDDRLLEIRIEIEDIRAPQTETDSDTPDTPPAHAARIAALNKEREEIKYVLENCEDGELLIHSRAWKDYVQQLAQDIAPSHEARDLMFNTWPYNCIDWDYATRELRHDYSIDVISGHEYYHPAS